MENVDRGHRLRRRPDRGLLLEAAARHRHLHRVRALPVGLPGLEHRQAALARSCSSWRCATTCSPRADRLAGRRPADGRRGGPTLVPDDHRPRRPVVVHHLRRLRGGVPGRHRARRHHRRHAPLRGAHGVASSRPRPGSCCATSRTRATPGASGQAKRTEWTEALDFEIPVITGTIPDDIEYLYWVGCAGALDERARKGAQATARHAAPGRRHLRHPRAPRSPAPATRSAASATSTSTRSMAQDQHRHPGRGRGQEDHRHAARTASTRITNEYPDLGGNFEVIHHAQLLEPPGDDGQAHARRRATRARSPTTTPATWAGTTGSSTSPARCSTPSPASSRSR